MCTFSIEGQNIGQYRFKVTSKDSANVQDCLNTIMNIHGDRLETYFDTKVMSRCFVITIKVIHKAAITRKMFYLPLHD